jgi:hypothetical protein
MANHQRRHTDSLRHNLFQTSTQAKAAESPVWFTSPTDIPRFIGAGQDALRKQLNFAESQVADREIQYISLEAQLTEQVIENTRLKTELAELQQAQIRSQAKADRLQGPAAQDPTENAQRQARDTEYAAAYAASQTQVADRQRQLRALLPVGVSGEWGVHRQHGRWPVQTYTRPKQLALVSSRWVTRFLLGLGLAVIIPWGWSLMLGMGPVEAIVTLVPKLVGPIGTLLLGVWLWATVAED